MILTFLGIVSGAALAIAWHLIAPPIVASIAASPVGRALRSRAALGILLALPFAAVAVAIGMNGDALRARLAAPQAPRNPALDQARAEAPHGLESAVKELEAKLAKNPNDQDGWRLLARSYAELNEPEKAADAARRAAALGAAPGDAASESARGEDLVTAAGGTVGPDARQAFAAALAADPGDPRARFFMGLAAAQDGKSDEALQRWLELERDSPADAPWLKGLRANIDRLAKGMGVSDADLAQRRRATASAAPPTPAAPAPAAAAAGAVPGPTAADVAAAANMSEGDRAAMIRSMVERLAERMKQNPKDVDGWLRLARAYDVLGEHAKALEAYRSASAADPSRQDVKQALADAQAKSGTTP